MLNWLHSFSTRKNSFQVQQAFAAIKLGQLKQLEDLLKNGVDANSRNERGFTLLHMSILTTTPHNEEYLLPLTTLLINYGANVNAYYAAEGDSYGPLHSAVRRKIPLSTKLLLDNEANKFLVDKRGKTPVDYANDKEFGNDRGEEIITLLQDHLSSQAQNNIGLS